MPTAAGLSYVLAEGGSRLIPPVVLLHGAGSSHLFFPSELRRLHGQNVVAVDLPGHGNSTGACCQSVSDYGEQILNFLDELNMLSFIPVGHSLGGAIALELALAAPQRVMAVGVISSGAYLAIPEDLNAALSGPVILPAAFKRLKQLAFGASLPEKVVEKVMKEMQQMRPSVLAGDWQAAVNFDVRSRVGSMRVPLWVAVGSQDMLTPPSLSHFLSEAVRGAQLSVFKGASHMLPLEQPEALSNSLNEFLWQVNNRDLRSL